MSDTDSKPRNRRRHFVLDDSSQSTTLTHHLLLLGGAAIVSALLLFGLSRGNVLGGQALVEAFPVLLAAQIGAFVLAAIATVVVVMRLTHRYVGPAHVMERALKGMRLGDYGCRLTLRHNDFLRPLAQEINTHRSQLARRDIERERMLTSLDQLLERGDVDGARALVAELVDQVPHRRVRRSA